MFRFSIRDVLWLTVVVALAMAWWVDNQRIEKAVSSLKKERELLEADFADRVTILDELQKERRLKVNEAILTRQPLPRN